MEWITWLAFQVDAVPPLLTEIGHVLTGVARYRESIVGQKPHWFYSLVASLFFCYGGAFASSYLLAQTPRPITDDLCLSLVCVCWYLLFHFPFAFKMVTQNQLIKFVLIIVEAIFVVRLAVDGFEKGARLFPTSYVCPIVISMANASGGGIFFVVEVYIRGREEPHWSNFLHILRGGFKRFFIFALFYLVARDPTNLVFGQFFSRQVVSLILLCVLLVEKLTWFFLYPLDPLYAFEFSFFFHNENKFPLLSKSRNNSQA